MNTTKMTLRSFALEIAEQEIQLIQRLKRLGLSPAAHQDLHEILCRSLTRITNWLEAGRGEPTILPKPKAATEEATEIIQVLTNCKLRQNWAELDRDLRALSLTLLYMDVCQARVEDEGRNGGNLSDRMRERSGAVALVIDEAKAALRANAPTHAAETAQAADLTNVMAA